MDVRRVFGWLGICLLMTLTGIFLLAGVLTREDLELSKDEFQESKRKRVMRGRGLRLSYLVFVAIGYPAAYEGTIRLLSCFGIATSALFSPRMNLGSLSPNRT
jgi:hypothetical protein